MGWAVVCGWLSESAAGWAGLRASGFGPRAAGCGYRSRSLGWAQTTAWAWFVEGPYRRLSGQWPSVAEACLEARLVCSGMQAGRAAWQHHHCSCSGILTATTEKWAGGNTVNAAIIPLRQSGSESGADAESEERKGSTSCLRNGMGHRLSHFQNIAHRPFLTS